MSKLGSLKNPNSNNSPSILRKKSSDTGFLLREWALE